MLPCYVFLHPSFTRIAYLFNKFLYKIFNRKHPLKCGFILFFLFCRVFFSLLSFTTRWRIINVDLFFFNRTGRTKLGRKWWNFCGPSPFFDFLIWECCHCLRHKIFSQTLRVRVIWLPSEVNVWGTKTRIFSFFG